MTERSGTVRMVWVAVLIPGATCQVGRDHVVEMPPPLAPQFCEVQSSFQTDSVNGSVSVTARPPTPVT